MWTLLTPTHIKKKLHLLFFQTKKNIIQTKNLRNSHVAFNPRCRRRILQVDQDSFCWTQVLTHKGGLSERPIRQIRIRGILHIIHWFQVLNYVLAFFLFVSGSVSNNFGSFCSWILASPDYPSVPEAPRPASLADVHSNQTNKAAGFQWKNGENSHRGSENMTNPNFMHLVIREKSLKFTSNICIKFDPRVRKIKSFHDLISWPL